MNQLTRQHDQTVIWRTSVVKKNISREEVGRIGLGVEYFNWRTASRANCFDLFNIPLSREKYIWRNVHYFSPRGSCG